MKVIFTSDWHIDATTAGVSRIDEFDAYLAAIVEAVKAEGIEVVFVLGDFFDPGKMNAHEMTTRLFEAVTTLAGTGADVVVIAGNHDVVETSGGYTTISPLIHASRFGYPDDRSAPPRMGRVYAHDRTAAFEVGGIAVLALPFVSRVVEDSEENREAHIEAFRKAAELSKSSPLVVIGHYTVPGAILSSESREMSRGRDLDFPFEEVARLRPRVVANGHYHKAQVVKAAGIEVLIPGSPHRFTFGEREDAEKGFLIVDVGLSTYLEHL